MKNDTDTPTTVMRIFSSIKGWNNGWENDKKRDNSCNFFFFRFLGKKITSTNESKLFVQSIDSFGSVEECLGKTISIRMKLFSFFLVGPFLN